MSAPRPALIQLRLSGMASELCHDGPRETPKSSMLTFSSILRPHTAQVEVECEECGPSVTPLTHAWSEGRWIRADPGHLLRCSLPAQNRDSGHFCPYPE